MAEEWMYEIVVCLTFKILYLRQRIKIWINSQSGYENSLGKNNTEQMLSFVSVVMRLFLKHTQ